ncbi:hypothetical protein HORIV_13820 [Vreelandella olivaria]|uniref:Uncharacterized protein n=1 Tax=Vreelandella olivaria TaxID=390919 RepID=A0ABN5WWP8_9GAMM|nr:hypothetical protein HORIV_13820 [Halomonas olivaria]
MRWSSSPRREVTNIVGEINLTVIAKAGTPLARVGIQRNQACIRRRQVEPAWAHNVSLTDHYWLRVVVFFIYTKQQG